MTESDWQITELDDDEPLPTTSGEDDSSEPDGVGDDNFDGGDEPADFDPHESTV